MAEEDVEVRSTEDLKDYFEEIVQHEKMEEKASVEDEVPYVFKTNNMCLTIGYACGTKGQLMNIFQQFEEDEDEGKIMDMWNVYILHIYLLTLLQVFCKWIVGMLNDEAWFPNGSKISFHLLKENAKE